MVVFVDSTAPVSINKHCIFRFLRLNQKVYLKMSINNINADTKLIFLQVSKGKSLLGEELWQMLRDKNLQCIDVCIQSVFALSF